MYNIQYTIYMLTLMHVIQLFLKFPSKMNVKLYFIDFRVYIFHNIFIFHIYIQSVSVFHVYLYFIYIFRFSRKGVEGGGVTFTY
jgi:hypothetical protein